MKKIMPMVVVERKKRMMRVMLIMMARLVTLILNTGTALLRRLDRLATVMAVEDLYWLVMIVWMDDSNTKATVFFAWLLHGNEMITAGNTEWVMSHRQHR